MARLSPWAFLSFAFVYLYAFPYFDQLRSANEMPRILLTQEMVDHGRFFLDARRGDLGSTLDTSWGPDGHLYANKAPGLSFLAVPAYLLCKVVGATSLRACTWAFRVTAVTLPALLFLPFFYRLASRFSPSEPARRTALVAYALASPALPYALLFMSHAVAAAAIGGSFVAAVALTRREAQRPWLAALGAGFLAALAVSMDYHAVFAATLLGLYAVAWAPRRLVQVPLLVLGALPPGLALAAYHQACFGSPFKTGYSFAVDPVTQEGFLGIVGPNRIAFAITLTQPANGLLVLAPWVLFALLGLGAIAVVREARARVGREALLAALIVASYVLFLGSLTSDFARAGWCVGPRYLVVALPFVAWLAVAGFGLADRHPISRLLAQAAVLTGGVIFLTAAVTYPHWPTRLVNPLYELAFPLLYHGYAVHSLGTVLGLTGIWATLPLLVFATGLGLWLLRRPGRRQMVVTGCACLLAALLVLSYRTFPLTGPDATLVWKWVTSTWEPGR